MQICHVLDKDCRPERFEVVTVISLWVASACIRHMTGNPGHPAALLAMVASGFECLRFCVVMSLRIAAMLKIGVFAFTDKAVKTK